MKRRILFCAFWIVLSSITCSAGFLAGAYNKLVRNTYYQANSVLMSAYQAPQSFPGSGEELIIQRDDNDTPIGYSYYNREYSITFETSHDDTNCDEYKVDGTSMKFYISKNGEKVWTYLDTGGVVTIVYFDKNKKK